MHVGIFNFSFCLHFLNTMMICNVKELFHVLLFTFLKFFCKWQLSQIYEFLKFHWYKENHNFSALFLEGGKANLFFEVFSVYYLVTCIKLKDFKLFQHNQKES